MGSTTANGLITNLPNYGGKWVVTSPKKTPFATLLGLQNMGAGAQSPFAEVGAMKFPMGQSYSLNAASQSPATENQTLSAPTSKVYATSQVLNYCQVERSGLHISDLKLSDRSLSGVAISGETGLLQDLNRQIGAHLKQLKRNYEYSIINGVAQDGSSNPDTAFRIGGLYTGLSTNKINASSAAISKALLEESLFASILDNGGDCSNVIVMANSYQIAKLNALYGVQLRSNMMGGVNLLSLLIPMVGEVRLMYNDLVPAGVIIAADLAYIRGVSNTTPGRQQIDIRDLVTTGDGISVEVFAKIGIDYTHESKHGALYGLATS